MSVGTLFSFLSPLWSPNPIEENHKASSKAYLAGIIRKGRSVLPSRRDAKDSWNSRQ